MSRIWLVIAALVALPTVADEITVSQHWISSGLNNRDLTISPDGTLLMSTVMSPANQFAAIIVAERDGDSWGEPRLASFSGTWSDIEPMFTPDGDRLWFASNRPKPGREGDDWDLWYVDRHGGGWGEPVNPGPPINTGGNEFYPSVAANGNVYFTAEREVGEGSEDILRAIWQGGEYVRVESLGPGVNSARFEFNAFVAPDESYVIFTAQGGREGEIGRGDLYISRQTDGAFGEAKILPEPINSTLLDYCPFVHDGTLYFTSRRYADHAPYADLDALNDALTSPGNGMGDIYRVGFDALP